LGQIMGAILILYSWIVATALIGFLFLIGRFHEIKFRQRSGYQRFLLPPALFIAAAIWDAFRANSYTGDPLLDFVGALGPDLLFLAGGLILSAMCYSLFKTMMGGKR